MPPDWDADSPELRQNIVELLESIEQEAPQRRLPTIEAARQWQAALMRNLQADDPKYIGTFRGEAGLEKVQVQEWVRIHPFANGNGRTARLWANSLALRYGLPPFMSVRPRPGGDYEVACAYAMQGDWEPMAAVFHQMLDDFCSQFGSPSEVVPVADSRIATAFVRSAYVTASSGFASRSIRLRSFESADSSS